MRKSINRGKILVVAFLAALLVSALSPALVHVSAQSNSNDCLRRSNAKASWDISGDRATANFEIPKNCKNQKVTLASYTAPNNTNGRPYEQQKIYRWVTQTYQTSGKKSLSVKIPNCYYQVDLAKGNVIEEFSGTNTYAQKGNILASKHGGSNPCTPVHPPTTTPQTPTKPSTPVKNPNTKVVCKQLSGKKLSGSSSSKNNTYQFEPEMDSGNKGDLTAVSYDYGDGTVKNNTGYLTSHVFNKPGNYDVKMNGKYRNSDIHVSCSTKVVVVTNNNAGQADANEIEQDAAAVSDSNNDSSNKPSDTEQAQPLTQEEQASADVQTASDDSATTEDQSEAVQPAQRSSNGKLPDTGPGEVAAIGFIWTFMGGALYAYRDKFAGLVATIVSKL